MNQILSCVALLAALSPVAVLAETDASADETEATVRPGDEEGILPPSDGLAECAAILATTSPNATNLIDRNNMRNASALWFSASGDLAAEEGTATADGAWETKVTQWSERISSVDSMRQQEGWMAYCAAMATEHGLDGVFFDAPAE